MKPRSVLSASTGPRTKLRFRHAALLQLVVFLLAASVWFYFRTAAYLAGPPDPDTYAWSWSFQLIVFALFNLPKVLFAWCAVVLVEFGFVCLYHRVRAHSAASEA